MRKTLVEILCVTFNRQQIAATAVGDIKKILQYAARPTAFPPILINSLNGHILDGSHRMVAAMMRGDEEIDVEVTAG